METTPAHSQTHQTSTSEFVRKLGFWMFLSSEFLIFLGLIIAFASTRNSTREWPTQAELGLVLVSVNTLVLLASSYTVASGIEAIRRDRLGKLQFFLAMTMVLGIMFLLGQAVEYTNLIVRDGFTWSTPFGTAFFTLTGLHGLHVLVGVFWCLAVILRARKRIFTSRRYATVEIFGLYWHFVDVVWIFIFTIVYLLSP